MEEKIEESEEKINEDINNNIISSDSNYNLDLNISNNNNNLKEENNCKLLSEIITYNKENEYIKPPIYIDELVTKKNYDEVDINTFNNNINDLSEKIKELILLIQNNFSQKNENLFKLIKKYNIPYVNYFYSLTFIYNELFIISALVQFKYSENKNDINEYNIIKKSIYFESDIKDMDDYINIIRAKNKPFYDLMTEEEIESLKIHINELFELEKKMLNYYDKIDFIPGLIPIIICLNCYEMTISGATKSLKEMINSNYKKDHIIMAFLNHLSKISTLSYFINIIFYSFDYEYILNKKENDSLEWKLIKEHYLKIIPYNRDVIEKGLNKFLDFVKIGYASINKTKSRLNNKFKMYTSFGMYSTLYFFNKKKAITESNNFLMNPQLDALLTVWNMLDNPIFCKLVKIILPSVKYNHIFYIKRTQKEIDIKLIEELCKKTSNFNISNEEENNIIHELFIGNENKINDNLPLIKEKNKDDKTDENYVKIKVYNYEKLKFNKNIINESDIQNNINNDENNKKDEVKKTKTILIHVHGGGFVAMSPKSHENYTLKWAKNLKIPIFSIDYRLSPGVAFPKSLDDVYQSYIWILKYSKIIFNIDFDEIIIAGDSAGANLILSLNYLLIMNKIKLPKIIFMFYPALKIDIDTIVPSYLNAITELILEYHLLKFCIDSYSGKYTDNGKVITNTRNKFLSPIFMDDNILKLLPPIRIFGGSCDVLRDDTFYFMDKLLKLNKDAFFYEFKYFPHGYLNYDFKTLFPECSLITDRICKEIEKYTE